MTSEERASRYLDDNRRELILNFTEYLEHRKRQNPEHDRHVSGPRTWKYRPTQQSARPPPPRRPRHCPPR
jgi:hypothetical protein